MKKELARKFFHIFFGTIILILIYMLETQNSFYLLFTFTVIGIIIGYLIKKGWKLKPLNSIINFVEREHEKHFPGKAAIMFFLASLVVLILFQQDKFIVISILAVQIYADGFAAIYGKKFGKIKIFGKKTAAGSSTFFIISFFCLFLFFNPIMALILSLISSLIELLPIDDNFGVPIGLGISIKIIQFIL
jgi:dolichol kinase